MQDYEKLGVFYLGRECDASGKVAEDGLILYDSKDLTTHAVCVGMTGSGKTGLCLALLEEAAIDGIPALCIDPKGDLGNLALTFPNLAAADFRPWVDPAEAQRKGVTVDQLAEQTATQWKKGLADWGQAPDRIARFRDAAEVAIYTPGSESGLPLSVLRSFAAPPAEQLSDTTALRDRIGTLVSGLLSLLGRPADPLKSREHILLASLVEQAWRQGTSLDMAALIGAVQKPPLEKVGALDLETFFPAKDRAELAMAINNLLASPGFAAWMSGEPLDMQRLLFTAEGKPRIAILSIAHLSDSERMFIVTLALNEMISWMRQQPGTSSLRALFYMDEIFGYFPPTANPPSKPPMLTLLKQARAYGVGCVLATQNPVDLDYKGLSNAGTWLIGRLQTERDKLRVLEGLESVLAGASNYDRATLDKMISGITQRVFLMRNVHEDAPVLFKSRWALSYLRGPLTGVEIGRLMADRKSASARASAASGAATAASSVTGSSATASGTSAIESTSAGTALRPTLPAGVVEYFAPAQPGQGAITYRPLIMGLGKLHFVDSSLALDQWRTLAYVAPLSDDGSQPLWAEAQTSAELRQQLSKIPADGAAFSELPASAMRAASYAAWSKALSAQLYESSRATVLVCDALKASSAPDQPEGDFRAQLTQRAREQRDAAAESLRKKYAPKLATLTDRERRAQERIDREKSQLSQQKLQTAFSVGASVLGALFGRKTLSAANVNRAASAARAASRIGRESGDVDRAGESLEAIKQQQADLQQQFDVDVAALEKSMDAAAAPLRTAQVSPRKSDIAVGEVALLWMPWRQGTDGFPAPAAAVTLSTPR